MLILVYIFKEYILNKAEFYYENDRAPKPNRPIHMGTAIIILHQDKILMEYRTDSDYWALIGGGLDMDESLEACAIREAYEETGIEIKESNLKFYKVYSDPSRIVKYPDGNIVRSITTAFYYHAELPHTLKCSLESRELKYFSVDEIKKLKIVATHRHIIFDYIDRAKV